ncbi:MAG TPA: hypothetical protein VF712_03815 [Thermoleophilaceae bacterium]
MGVLDLAGSLAQLLDAIDPPLAHPLDYPHPEPAPPPDRGGASPALIGGGVVVTLALAGGLIWVRERTRRADESAALEGHAEAEPDQQGARAAVEPGDDAGSREEPA